VQFKAVTVWNRRQESLHSCVCLGVSETALCCETWDQGCVISHYLAPVHRVIFQLTEYFKQCKQTLLILNHVLHFVVISSFGSKLCLYWILYIVVFHFIYSLSILLTSVHKKQVWHLKLTLKLMLANVILNFTFLDCLKMTMWWIKHVATRLYNATTIQYNTIQYNTRWLLVLR
jgi:hypothetical protein